MVGPPDALYFAASGLHLTAAIADGVAEAAGGENTALNNTAIVANGAATAADAAAGVTDTVSGFGDGVGHLGFGVRYRGCCSGEASMPSTATITAATPSNNPVADPAGETAAAEGRMGR